MKRIKWLDVSRGIAFLMIIYSHIDFNNPQIMKYLTPVYLTTFFFVSGYLFKEKHSFRYVLEQRTRTLLLPFFLLGFIMILMGQILTFHDPISFEDALKGLLFQNWNNQILWFIAALYVYSIIFYWIERWAKTSKVLLITSFMLFFLNSLYLIFVGIHNIPWHVETAGFACFYMGLGKWYKENELLFDHYFNNNFIALICIILYFCIITVFNLNISFDGSYYIFDALAITIIGLFLMVYISKNVVRNNKYLMFVGSNTLFYFAFHIKAVALLQEIVYKSFLKNFLDETYFTNLTSILIVFLASIILALPTILVNRYCPWILGRGFKLWKVEV